MGIVLPLCQRLAVRAFSLKNSKLPYKPVMLISQCIQPRMYPLNYQMV